MSNKATPTELHVSVSFHSSRKDLKCTASPCDISVVAFLKSPHPVLSASASQLCSFTTCMSRRSKIFLEWTWEAITTAQSQPAF